MGNPSLCGLADGICGTQVLRSCLLLVVNAGTCSVSTEICYLSSLIFINWVVAVLCSSSMMRSSFAHSITLSNSFISLQLFTNVGRQFIDKLLKEKLVMCASICVLHCSNCFETAPHLAKVFVP